MIIGACRLEIVLPGNDSLKGKRRTRRSLVDRARRKFGLSVAEVEDHDSLHLLVLGAAHVSSDAVHARRVLQSFVNWVERTGMGYVRASHIELVRPLGPGLAHDWGDDEYDGKTEGS